MTRSSVVFGSSGGIGAAMADAFQGEIGSSNVFRFSRSGWGQDELSFDLELEVSIKVAAEHVANFAKPNRVVVTTGILSEGERGPEKSMRELDSDWMMKNFQINAIGPALIAKHFLPLMPRDERCVFAVLSARVGSISDNRLGGWYGYRASKAALNMLVRNLAIEQSRKNDRSIVVALHPGTVDTPLSRPFQGNVPAEQLFDPERAAEQLLDVIDGLTPQDTGSFFAWNGEEITP